MPAPKESEFRLSFPLDLGVDNTAHETAVQPMGERPALVRSVNTRLSVVRGCPTKAPGTTTLTDPVSHSGASTSGGVIPCGHVSSSLVMRQRRYGAQRIAGTALSALDCPLPGSAGVNNYWPADVSRAGALPGDGQYTPPAVCLLNGQIWTASIRATDNAGSIGVFVTVLGANGECIAAPEQVASVSGDAWNPPWVGITAHGANGIRLWHRDGTGTGVRIRTLTVADGDVTVTGGTVLYTPVSAGTHTYDVTAHGTQYAWFVTRDETTATSVALTKVDVATSAVVATRVTALGATISRLAVKSAAMSNGDCVAVMASMAASCTEMLFDGVTMGAAMHSFTGRLMDGTPACGFYRVGSTEYVCYGVFNDSASMTTSFPIDGGTSIEMRTVDVTGTLSGTMTLPWVQLISNFVHHSPASGEIYPLILTQPGFGGNPHSPSGVRYTSDPAIQVFRIDSTATASCIARVGVDTAAIYPPAEFANGAFGGGTLHWKYNSDAIYADGDKICFVYAETKWRALAPLFPLRYVELDMSARQPRYAIGTDGPALVAAAMPMEWDGVTLAECSPPHRPNVLVAVSGGSGDAISANTYYVSAVVSWRDAAGVTHRSMPGVIRTVAAAGAEWIIQVSTQPLVHDGAVQDSFDVEVYISLGGVGATTLYRQQITATTKTAIYWQFADVSTPVASVNNPVIYTTADALLPLPAQAPPCMYDVAVVQNRAWMINAERRRELWYTKPKEQSPLIGAIAYEWSSSCVERLPIAAGDGVAVVENGGTLTALCENGVWVVTGPGPNASLNDGASFNPPEQVSDIGCSSRDSVIRTPAGIMFRSNTRFAMVGPQGVRIVEEIDASALGTLVPVLLRDTQEVVWFSSTGTHMVYNYALDRWTTWTSTAAPAVVGGAHDPVSGLVNLIASSDATVRQMNPATASTAAQMVFETGHVAMGGPQDDNVVNEVVIHGVKAGTHGLTVAMETDYGASTVTRTYGSGDIDNCTVDGLYTLEMAPAKNSMRTMKLTVTETGASGEAMRPLSVTLVGHKNPTTKKDAVKARGRTPTGS